MTQIDGLSLTDAERAIEDAHPGWHIWHSRDGAGMGREYATNASSAGGGSGTTLDAPSVNRIEEEIARWEWEQERATGQAA